MTAPRTFTVSQKLDDLEAIGVNDVALAAVDRQSARELISDFGEQVIQRRRWRRHGPLRLVQALDSRFRGNYD